MLLRRAGLTASAGLSCHTSYEHLANLLYFSFSQQMIVMTIDTINLAKHLMNYSVIIKCRI